MTKHIRERELHGMTGTPEYASWTNMVARTNGRHPMYSHYKDVTIHKPWAVSFLEFLEHIGPAPGKGYTVDRIDNSKGYEPGNVRWANKSEQAKNRTIAILLSHEGKTQTIAEWAREKNIPASRLYRRHKDGYSVEDILSTGVGKNFRERVQMDDASMMDQLLATDEDFNPGCLVRLRSGGSPMVFDGYESVDGHKKARCYWHDKNGVPHSALYSSVLLKAN